MGVSVALILKMNKVRKDGTAPVYIRITASRKRRYIATDMRVHPRDWNEKRGEVRASHDLASAYNDRLKVLRLEAERQSLGAKSAAQVKAAVTGASEGSVGDCFQTHIRRMDQSGQFWEWKKFRSTLSKLEDCFGSPIEWDHLNAKGLQRFEDYMRGQLGNATNTLRKDLTRVRRIVKQAIRDGDMPAEMDPFLRYRMPKRTKVYRRKLSEQEIKALQEVVLVGRDATVRDAFLFAFYGSGIRFGDLATLKKENVKDGLLRYRMRKTGVLMEVRLPAPAQLISARHREGPFLFPFLQRGDDADSSRLRRRISSENAKANRTIKRVAEAVEIADPSSISFHVARHSFANLARGKTDLYLVSKSLGHQSLAITEQYLAGLQEDVDRAHSEIWGE